MIDHHADARRAEAVALHLVALQLAAALQLCAGTRANTAPGTLPPSAIPALEDWLQGRR